MSVDKTRIYRGDTSLLKAAALDLADSLGLKAGRLIIDFSTTPGFAHVSVAEHKEVRVLGSSEKEMK